MSDQFFWTTADIEKNTFFGETSSLPARLFATHEEWSGRYRVVCGALYRIADGAPTEFEPTEESR